MPKKTSKWKVVHANLLPCCSKSRAEPGRTGSYRHTKRTALNICCRTEIAAGGKEQT